MNTEAHRVGITPYLLRKAAYYVALGVGTYRQNVQPYTEVEVSLREEWKYDSEVLPRSGQLFRVDFKIGPRVIRWVEFVCSIGGFGGEPLIREVEPELAPVGLPPQPGED